MANHKKWPLTTYQYTLSRRPSHISTLSNLMAIYTMQTYF